MNRKINILLTFFAVLLLFLSCDEENTDNKESDLKALVSEGISQSGNYSLKLFAKDTLFEGYNKLYLELSKTNSGDRINQAGITMFPLMHMLSKVHAAPVENPDTLIGESGYFEGAVVFIMPSNPDENWTIDFAIHIGSNYDTIHLNIPVVRSLEESRKINVISDIDQTVYFISLIEPSEPKVGVNIFELTVHYKQNMMSFPIAGDLTFEIEPEMPSMDHGSPNNVNPVYTGEGHYVGQVNFTMTGWWRVHLKVKNGNEILSEDDIYFDITF